MSEKLFIKATRKKYRFDSSKGQLTTEDLWDLSLESLDRIAVALDDKIQKAGRKSFINKTTNTLTEDTAKLDILKYVIETKQEDAARRMENQARAKERQFLEDLLKNKQMETLSAMSEKEIADRLAAINAAEAPGDAA